MRCFKAYDIRGRIPDELNEDIAWRIGRSLAEYLSPEKIIIGGDIRLSTPALKQALSNGLRAGNVDVLDIGLCGTEEIYYAVSHLKACGGVMVTASHNPLDYNGMKLVREQSKPISRDSGLSDIAYFVENKYTKQNSEELTGSFQHISTLSNYVDHVLNYITLKNIKPLRLLVNAGNGAAGHVIDAIEKRFKTNNVPVEFIKILHNPDGSFPQGVPNPLLEECRQITSDAVIKHNADMGIAWDGDFDRCFFFDEKGNCIEGYYIVGLLGEAFLAHAPGEKIIHDPRLTWNTIDQIKSAGGVPVLCKSGHGFIKERMRKEDAIYGGEMSAHHYFREFNYCDSGMIPWLLVAELISRKNASLSELVNVRIQKYPSSSEINLMTEHPQDTINHVLENFKNQAVDIDYTDGVSINMSSWRFNLRSSNTEPVIRLNVEAKGDRKLLDSKTTEIMKILKSH